MKNPEVIPEIISAIELRASYMPSELLRRAVGNLTLQKYTAKVEDGLSFRSAIRRVVTEGEYNIQSIKNASVRRASDEFLKLPKTHILFDGSIDLDDTPARRGLKRLILNARLNRTTLAARDILGTIPSLEQEPVEYDSSDRPRPHAMFIDLPESFFPTDEHERRERLQALHLGLVQPHSHYVVPQALRALQARILLKPADTVDTADT